MDNDHHSYFQVGIKISGCGQGREMHNVNIYINLPNLRMIRLWKA